MEGKYADQNNQRPARADRLQPGEIGAAIVGHDGASYQPPATGASRPNVT